MENRVLASLPPAELAALSRYLHVVPLPPISELQQHDRRPDFVYFPHDGLISLLAVTPTGETIEAASMGRAGAVCPIHMSDQRDGFLTVVAHGATRATRMATTQLLGAERELETFGAALRACRQALVLQMRQNLACRARHTVEHRLARWVLEAADRLESDRISIPVTQEHVAGRLGVRRTTVTLLASKLQDAGAIQWRRSRVDILDRRRLEPVACGCYAELRERVDALLPRPRAAPVKNLGA